MYFRGDKMLDYLFSVRVYHNTIDGLLLESIQEEIAKLISINESNLNFTWGDQILTTFKNNTNVVENSPIFKKFIMEEIDIYLKEFQINKKNPEIYESWIALSKKDGYQNFHTHLYDANISGVYYYKTNTEDGDIVFKTDSGGINHSILNLEVFKNYKPEIGKIILFPSFLEHKVSRNLTDNDRISIAFNCKLT